MASFVRSVTRTGSRPRNSTTSSRSSSAGCGRSSAKRARESARLRAGSGWAARESRGSRGADGRFRGVDRSWRGGPLGVSGRSAGNSPRRLVAPTTCPIRRPPPETSTDWASGQWSRPIRPLDWTGKAFVQTHPPPRSVPCGRARALGCPRSGPIGPGRRASPAHPRRARSHCSSVISSGLPGPLASHAP